jgi:hypothetical protein
VNARIQRRFIESLKAVSSSFNLELIVVQYNEENVEQTLVASGLNCEFVKLPNTIPYYRYSLSEVVTRGFEKSSGELVIYTTCDMVFTPNLLSEVCNTISLNGILIPHPYPEMPVGVSESDYMQYQLITPHNTGFDIFVFSRVAVEKFLQKKCFERYKF